MSDLFTGQLVRLTTARPEPDAARLAKWDGDSQFRRLLDSDAPRLSTEKQLRSGIEKEEMPDNPKSKM